MNDGKRLETLVRQVEELLLPQGFEVRANRRIFDEDGVPIAEFDIEIAGRVGSTDMTWLIECRDREGPAPAAWIEQLVGRRDRFGFNKVMAVSTTGFAPGAVAYGKEAGIELRSVNDLDVRDLPHWLGVRHMTAQTTHYNLKAAHIGLSDNEGPDRVQALKPRMSNVGGDDKVLRPTKGGQLISFGEAFALALANHPVIADLVPNGEAKKIRARVRYANDQDHLVIDTDAGPVRVREILFLGEVSLIEKDVPFDALKEYRREGRGEPISQTVSFPLELHDGKYSLELHNLADTGETHVLLRKNT